MAADNNISLRYYTLFGVLFGMLFPIAATLVACRVLHRPVTLAGMIEVQASDPLLWIIDSAPLWLGLMSALIGNRQVRYNRLVVKLKEEVRDQTFQLQQTVNYQENIFHSMADLIIVMDPDGIIRDVNISTLRTFGYERSDLVGKSVSTVLGEADKEHLLLTEAGDLFESGFLKTLEGTYQNRYGDTIVLSGSVTYVWNDQTEVKSIIWIAQNITERKQQEEELQKAKAAYELLFESSPLPIVVIQDGLIVFHNSVLEKRYGFSTEDLRNQTFVRHIHPDERETVMGQYRKYINDDNYSDLMSFRMITAGGEARSVRLSATKFVWEERPAELVYIIDVTNQLAMEDALRVSESKHKTIFEYSPVSMFVLRNGYPVFMNAATRRLYGVDENDRNIGHFTSFIYEEDRERMARNHATRMRGEKVPDSLQFRIVTSQNEVRWVEQKAVLTKWDNEQAVLCFQTDITDRKADEQMIDQQNRQLNDNFQQMTEELDQAKNAQTALFASAETELSQVRMATRYEPMAQIGGDFFDLTHIENERLEILVGDVTGHGIPAALLSFLFHATVKQHRRNDPSPEEVIRTCNRSLAGKLPAGKCATLFYCWYDFDARHLWYTCAGHPPAFLIRPQSSELIYLDTSGTVVGMFAEPPIPFESRKIDLLKGDKILIYTDGIIELFDENERIQGSERLEQLLISLRHESIQQLVNRVYEFSLEVSNKQILNDDVTMVGFEVIK